MLLEGWAWEQCSRLQIIGLREQVVLHILNTPATRTPRGAVGDPSLIHTYTPPPPPYKTPKLCISSALKLSFCILQRLTSRDTFALTCALRGGSERQNLKGPVYGLLTF